MQALSFSGGETTAWGDVSGARLDPEAVKQARKTEMELFNSMKACSRCRRSCVEAEGGWIDVNKGDTMNPNHRSRLVDREYNEYRDDSLYASTPPVEAMRIILSSAATCEGDEPGQHASRREVIVNDVSRSYFYAPYGVAQGG